MGRRNKKKVKDKFKINEKDLEDITKLMKDVPNEILGEIRARVSLYQTEHDWLKHRYMADMLINSVSYDNKLVGKMLREGVLRVAKHYKRYMPYDKCDNYDMCRTRCEDKYNFECKDYVRGMRYIR